MIAIVLQGAGEMPRDWHLNQRDISNAKAHMERLHRELDKKAADSLGKWVASHQDHVLAYKENGEGATVEDRKQFYVAFSTPALLKLMVKFGHDRPFLLGSTAGTNLNKVDPSLCFQVGDDLSS